MSEVTTLFPVWKQAVLDFLAAKFEAGQIVTHEWLNEHFRLRKPETIEEYEKHRFDLLQNMDEFRECLLEDYNVALKTKPGVGYEIVASAEQTQYAVEVGMRRVRSELRWMSSHLVNIDHSKLTSDQRRENADALARAAMLKGMFRKARRMEIAAPAKRIKKAD